MFFSFDGIDGVGKSTQMELFCRWLAAEGHDVVTCRDPGSTPLGERIREIVLHADDGVKIDPTSEMLLYMAARAQLVTEIIQPAIAAGKVVVSDRFVLANIVYQAYAGGLDVEEVRRVGHIAVQGTMPNAVFLLDMTPEAADTRLQRSLDRMENRGPDFRRRLRDGFLAEAARPDSRIHVINADQAVERVQADIRSVAQRLLSQHR